MGIREIYYRLSPELRILARRLVYLPLDALDLLRGKRGIRPPRGKVFIGSGDFEEIGNAHLDLFVRLGGLEPGHNVLDIGSGIGRMAIPLTGYLLPTSVYDGFDIVRQGIDWCKKRISSRHPNFRFTHIPLQNDLYVSQGGDAALFEFPFPGAFYDFVILTSVFTHMQPDEVSRYLEEMHRVMKPGARAFVNFFIINDHALDHMPPAFRFRHDHDDYFLMNDKVKSANIAYRETYIDRLIEAAGLEVAHKYYGKWCGHAGAPAFQDIYILRRSFL